MRLFKLCVITNIIMFPSVHYHYIEGNKKWKEL
jgi:hypothetical protein